jgi:hypothetical protein
MTTPTEQQVESPVPVLSTDSDMPEWVAEGIRTARTTIPDNRMQYHHTYVWLADALDKAQRERDAARNCLAFFSSVIKSGEPWTPVCQQEYDKARASLPSPEGKL